MPSVFNYFALKKNSDDCYKSLTEIAGFKKNWNNYGADPFDDKLIDRVYNLLNTLPFSPKLFPTANDSIQLEYYSGDDYLEFEVFVDKIVMSKKLGNEFSEEKRVSASKMPSIIEDFILKE